MGRAIVNRKVVTPATLWLASACSAPVNRLPAEVNPVCPNGVEPEESSKSTGTETPSSASSTTFAPGIPSDSSGGDEDCAILERRALAVLSESCVSCHRPGGQAAGTGVPDIRRLDDMIETGKLVPGRPFESVLFTRVYADTMPPVGVEPRVSSDDADVLEEWIASCIESDEDCVLPFVGTDEMLSEILEDAQGLGANERPFARYLSLVHLQNQGICGDELDAYRYATSRTLNGLSLDPELTSPEPVGSAGLIYRLDLRDYDWEDAAQRGTDDDDDWNDDDDDQGADDLWQVLVESDPFAIQYEQDDARAVAELVGENVFVLHADWMVHDANTGQLYYDMARVPNTVSKLEAQLGIDIAENIADLEVERIGFRDSGVSDQNRVIERHKTNVGSLWISSDFADGGNGRKNVFSNPLDFQPDGGEIIFSLPNGLTAFAVSDAKGNILDGAATSIVVDPKQQDSVVRSGISCLTCHVNGYIPKDDEILSFVLGSTVFSAAEKEDVADLYPRGADSRQRLAQDSATYLQAEQNLLPTPNRNGLPPVAWAFYQWDADLGLKKAAAELGIPENTLLSNIGGLDPQLAPLGSGRKITREVWGDFFADSVCRLNLGQAQSQFCF